MYLHSQHGEASAAASARRLKSGPAWVRLLATVCLVMVVLLSTAQVCHVHANALSKQGSRQGDTTPEDHCPLCVAMHSALPADIHVEPELLVSVRVLDSVAADAERMFRWRFEMASRPPPSSPFLA